MEAVKVLAWAFWMLVSVWAVFALIGSAGLVAMFPEGRRWWQLPAQWASLGMFSAAVLCHPF